LTGTRSEFFKRIFQPTEKFPRTPRYHLALGSMLWFSAIFANFRQKTGVFLKNQCYDHNFCKN
jgi:hypothetical protein